MTPPGRPLQTEMPTMNLSTGHPLADAAVGALATLAVQAAAVLLLGL